MQEKYRAIACRIARWPAGLRKSAFRLCYRAYELCILATADARRERLAARRARTNRWRGLSALLDLDRRINENRPLGEAGTLEGNNFITDHCQLLIDGAATEESIQLVYGWFGNVITAMGQRYKRGNKTMRLGIKIMARGRRALTRAWRRWVRWKVVKLEGDELPEMLDAYDLAIATTPSLSKIELREAFRLSDARHKRFEKRAQIATYMR